MATIASANITPAPVQGTVVWFDGSAEQMDDSQYLSHKQVGAAAEALYDLFGPRVIGLQIGRSGNGTTFERRPVRNGAVLVYRVGRTFLLDLLLAEFRSGAIRFHDHEDSRRAFAQLEALEPEQSQTGIVYKCPAGQHDDLGMSLAMLTWAARHLHFDHWARPIFDAHRPRRPAIDGRAVWRAFT